jgi:MFS family permease
MVVLAATGFAVGVGGPSRDMMIKKATPKGATGRVYGTVYSGLDVGFAVSPLIFGVFMDRGWYAPPWPARRWCCCCRSMPRWGWGPADSAAESVHTHPGMTTQSLPATCSSNA